MIKREAGTAVNLKTMTTTCMKDKVLPTLNKISDYVFYHAEQNAEAEALIWQQQRISYGDLAEQVKMVSCALIARGIVAGDRVALLGAPRPEFFIVMLAVVDIGAIWMAEVKNGKFVFSPSPELGERAHSGKMVGY